MCAGLLLHACTPARLTPLLFLIFGLSFPVPFPPDTKRTKQTELPWAGLFAGAAALAAAPVVIYFAVYPEHLFLRSSQLWIFDASRIQGSSLVACLENVWGYLLAFCLRGDPNWRHSFLGKPLLNLWEACLIRFGVGAAMWRWKRPACRLPLLWLVVQILPATPAVESTQPPNTVRMIGAMPAVYLLVAAGTWEAFRPLKTRDPALSTRAVSINPSEGTSSAVAVSAVGGCLIPGKGVITYRVCFEAWAIAPELREAYQVKWTDMAKKLSALPSDVDMAKLVTSALSSRHNRFEFPYIGASPVHFISSRLPFAPQRI